MKIKMDNENCGIVSEHRVNSDVIKFRFCPQS